MDNLVKNYPLSSYAKQIINDNTVYSNWGAVGPDYLFFYPPDWSGGIGAFMKAFYEFDELTKETIAVFEGAAEIYTAPKERLLELFTGGVYGELQSTLGSFASVFAAKIADLLTNTVDLFEQVTPPMHTKYTAAEVKDWWWIDIAHHVKPLDFSRELWKNARGNNKFKAYSYGYLSHVGSDIVGHGYVNAVVGGPYRNHWRRHSLVEKCLDTYLWDSFYNGKSISDSQAYKLIHFDNAPYEFPLLPGDLADFISKTLKDVYSGLNVSSGIPQADDVQLMYSYFYKWAKSSSSKSLLNLPPPPPDFDWWSLPEDVRNVLDSIGAPPPVTGPPLSNFGNLSDWKRFFLSLFKFISWVLNAIVTIISIPVYILMRMLTTPLRYVIWLLQKFIYELYESSRIALALGGFIHPEKKHLERYFNNIIHPNSNQILEQYPFEKVINSQQTYHLIHPLEFPGHTVELPNTKAFFNIRDFIPEKYFLEQINISDFSNFETALSLAQSDSLRTLIRNPLSASDFSYSLFNKFENDGGNGLPNWNLDVDRGLGWPQWNINNQKPWMFDNFTFTL